MTIHNKLKHNCAIANRPLLAALALCNFGRRLAGPKVKDAAWRDYFEASLAQLRDIYAMPC